MSQTRSVGRPRLYRDPVAAATDRQKRYRLSLEANGLCVLQVRVPANQAATLRQLAASLRGEHRRRRKLAAPAVGRGGSRPSAAPPTAVRRLAVVVPRHQADAVRAFAAALMASSPRHGPEARGATEDHRTAVSPGTRRLLLDGWRTGNSLADLQAALGLPPERIIRLMSAVTGETRADVEAELKARDRAELRIGIYENMKKMSIK